MRKGLTAHGRPGSCLVWKSAASYGCVVARLSKEAAVPLGDCRVRTTDPLSIHE